MDVGSNSSGKVLTGWQRRRFRSAVMEGIFEERRGRGAAMSLAGAESMELSGWAGRLMKQRDIYGTGRDTAEEKR